MTTPAKLIVTAPSFYAGRRTLRALRAAVPGAVVRGAGFGGIFAVQAPGDAQQLAQTVQRGCAGSIGRVMAVLAEVPSALEPIREAAVAIGGEQIGAGESFCFRLHKRGAHGLEPDTPTLEYEIGGAIWVALQRRDGRKPRVDLTDPDVTVEAEVLGPTTAVCLRRKAWRAPAVAAPPAPREGAPPRLAAALFDYGGVLAEEGFREGLYAIAREQGRDPEALHRLGLEVIYGSGYIVGRSSNVEFWRTMRERAGIRGGDAELTAMVLERFVLRPRMMSAVRALRSQGVRVAILSDQTDLLDHLEARDNFFRHFDAVFNSHHVGKSKRDPTLFDDAACSLGVQPAETLFVDDDPANVERARSRGLRGLLFRDVGSFLVELEAILRAAGPLEIGAQGSAPG